MEKQRVEALSDVILAIIAANYGPEPKPLRN